MTQEINDNQSITIISAEQEQARQNELIKLREEVQILKDERASNEKRINQLYERSLPYKEAIHSLATVLMTVLKPEINTMICQSVTKQLSEFVDEVVERKLDGFFEDERFEETVKDVLGDEFADMFDKEVDLEREIKSVLRDATVTFDL